VIRRIGTGATQSHFENFGDNNSPKHERLLIREFTAARASGMIAMLTLISLRQAFDSLQEILK
jgi:hypothetical protein